MNDVHHFVRKLCETAFDIAESMSLHLSIVAVDLGGHPIVILRGDRASFPSVEAARRKAVAAASMGLSTAAIVDMLGHDALVQQALHASGDMLIVPGGFPILFGDGCVGGFGISGGHYTEDQMVGDKTLAAMKAAAVAKEG
jgi:uncharacterized protein GlcG (DUF336 family)